MKTVGGWTVLDKDDYEPELKDLEVGKSGWIVPWAVMPDNEGVLYLRLEWSYDIRPMGTVDTQVTRLAEDRWRVWFTRPEKFTRMSDPNPHWLVSRNLEVICGTPNGSNDEQEHEDSDEAV